MANIVQPPPSQLPICILQYPMVLQVRGVALFAMPAKSLRGNEWYFIVLY
jgi:hypothetical protein